MARSRHSVAGSEMTRHFCTYFDRNYLSRGLALIESLRRHCPSLQLWVLCLDAVSFDYLRKQKSPDLKLITLEEFERADAPLLAAKANRSTVEYYFTCTPSLPRFVLRTASEIDLITYLDADLYFHHSPEALFAELGANSVGIVGHRFTPRMRHMEAYGLFNVAWLSFRRDERGLGCLEWWRERCLEWCYHREDNGRYGDQKYLDDWPVRFPGVKVLEHNGANVAVWNLENHAVSVADGQVMIGGQPLIFFHYHGLKQTLRWVYDLNVAFYGYHPDTVVLREIFAPYFRALHRHDQRLPATAATRSPATLFNDGGEFSQKSWREKKHALRSIWNDVALRNQMVVVRGRWLPLAELRDWVRR